MSEHVPAWPEDPEPISPWRIHVPSVTIDERVHQGVHLLLWQVRGESTFILDGEQRPLSTGHALWVPAGVRHAFTVHLDSVLLPMFFDAAQLATTLQAPTLIVVDRDLRTLFLAQIQMHYSIIQPAVNIDRQILALIEERPVLASALPMPSSDAARVIAETLRFNPGDDRSLAELADGVHTSTRTIERAFLTETGLTLRDWRIRNRMEAAAVLLRTAANVEAVAHRVGYSNHSAFGRVFRGHFGMAPSEYAARYRVQR